MTTTTTTTTTSIPYEFYEDEDLNSYSHQSLPQKMISPKTPSPKLTLTESENSSSPSLAGTLSTCPTSTHFSFEEDDCLSTINAPFHHRPDGEQHHYYAQQEGGALGRPPVIDCHSRSRHQGTEEFPPSPSSVCSTDAIYHLYPLMQDEEESNDAVSSIGSPSFSRHNEKEEQLPHLADDLVSLVSSFSLPQHAIVTPRAKTNRRSSIPSCTSTPPIVLRRQSAPSPMSLPWDEEVLTRLEEEEDDIPPTFSLEEDCDNEDDETIHLPTAISPQSASSLSSSSPIERKCVLQNSALTAMIAQTNAMLMLDEIDWIYHNKNAPQTMQCPTPSFVTPKKEDFKGTTSPYDDAPYDCDDDGESDEQEEVAHSRQRMDTLHHVEEYTNKAVRRSRNMAAIVRSVERRFLEARWDEDGCHLSIEAEVDSHGSHRRRCRRSDYLDNHGHHQNTGTRRGTTTTTSRPTSSIPKQVLLNALKITSILILTFFTIVSLEIVLAIAVEKGKMMHSFFISLSHDHFFTIWDLVAVGIMFGITTLDVAVISSLMVSKTTNSSWSLWNSDEEGKCEHPMIDEIRVLKVGKERNWITSLFSR